MSAALRRRVRELAGLGLIALASVGAIALATWSVRDPSLSYATGGPVHNLLGVWGALAADLLMQLFGLAAITLVLPVALWGWRLFTHRPLDRMRLRLGLWVAGAPLFAGFIACLARPASWPLPTGLGGVIGDALLRLPAWFAGGVLSGMPRLIIALILGIAAFLVLVPACGIGFHAPAGEDAEEEEESDESAGVMSIVLGWIGHGLLSLRAAITRAIVGFISARSAKPAPAAHRVEPRFGSRSAAKAEADDSEAEEEDEEDGEEGDDDEEEGSSLRVTPRKGERSA